MAADATEPRLIINDLRGGRNGTEPPLSLRDPTPAQGNYPGHGGECVEAYNVDWWNASLCRKRSGASAFPLQGITPNPNPITGVVSFLGRHLPGIDETQAAVWMADDATPNPVIAVQRFTPSAGVFAPPTQDPCTGNGWDVQGASIHGKYMLAYDSGQARLHCWDPTTDTIRRCGLRPPGPVAAGNAGSGTYPIVTRGYRVRVITMPGSIVLHRSEPGFAGYATPNGTSQGLMVILPPPIGEGETHWELEATVDGTTWYVLQTMPIAATQFLDTILTTTYGSLPLSPLTGTYNLQRSYRFLAVDQNRILGFGSFTSTDPQNRLEFSAVAGSTNIADEERVPLQNYIDLDEVDSGIPTGLIGPIYGAFYAFKYRQVWKLTPTGNAAQPYSLYPVSKVIGAVSQNSIDLGEDASGNPVVYFMSTRGPYRLGVVGLEYLGLPVEDLLQGPTRVMNLDATKVVAHTIYHTQKRQVWFWYAAVGSNDPNVKLVFDIRRSAWAFHEGPSAAARCSLMISRVLAPSSSHDLKPYIGQTGGVQRVWRCDDDTVTTDAGTAFQAYVLSKPYVLGGMGAYCTVTQGTLMAPASSGTAIQQLIIRDFGKETQLSTVDLTPSASGETHVMRLFDAGSMAGCWAVQFKWQDAGPIANQWALDAVTVNYLKEQAVV
jgi:hypothetical protein